MDDDLVSESTEQKSFTDMFREFLPFFMSMGMSYEEYYEKDMELTKFYYQALKYKQKMQNELAWLQGLYVYEAFSVVEYNVNRKKGQQPRSYSDKPYKLFEDEVKQDNELKVKEERAKAKVWMLNLVNSYKGKKG